MRQSEVNGVGIVTSVRLPRKGYVSTEMLQRLSGNQDGSATMGMYPAVANLWHMCCCYHWKLQMFLPSLQQPMWCGYIGQDGSHLGWHRVRCYKTLSFCPKWYTPRTLWIVYFWNITFSWLGVNKDPESDTKHGCVWGTTLYSLWYEKILDYIFLPESSFSSV